MCDVPLSVCPPNMHLSPHHQLDISYMFVKYIFLNPFNDPQEQPYKHKLTNCSANSASYRAFGSLLTPCPNYFVHYTYTHRDGDCKTKALEIKDHISSMKLKYV